MKTIAVFVAVFVAAAMGSGLVDHGLIHSERFGHALFREGGLYHEPILHKEFINPITYENHYIPHIYDGTYEHGPILDNYALRFPHEFRTFPTELRYTPEAITTDFRYNLPYGYSHRLLH